MTKKQDTLDSYEDMDDVFDQEFLENEFEDQLTEWRTNYEQSSDYCSRN